MGFLRTLLPMTSFLRLIPISLLCLAPLAAQAQERAPERPPERAPERAPERVPEPRAPERSSEPQVRVPERALERAPASDVPREMLPPAGKCRIWMDGVAPSQQPAPTDCQTALRQRPTNGTVVFGPATKDAPVSGFTRPRTTRDTTVRETRPSRTARPASSSTRSDTSSRRRTPEPQF
jgi:hypothetical protein